MSYKGDPNWSEDYWYCRMCHKTTHHHVMEGYCQKCFNKLEAEVVIESSKRTCLKCGEIFESECSGNRRCSKCQKKEPSTRYRHRININSK